MSKRKHIIITVIFLAAMFFVGRMVKELVEESRLAEESLHASEQQSASEEIAGEESPVTGEELTEIEGRSSGKELAEIEGRSSGKELTGEKNRSSGEETAEKDKSSNDEMTMSSHMLEALNWGLGFGEAGTRPTGTASQEEMAEYDAYFIAPSAEEMKLYLTFDCGYENGNTEAILDALKKHGVSATFFVVGHYLESAPEMVCRMVEEGHTVGNHTYHHPDMSKISDRAAFQKEVDDVADKYKEVTGQEMTKYYRPPQGKYSTQNLQMAKDMGYSTFFWSLAYVDWNVDDQPSHEEAFSKLLSRVHPGAIVLLHNTSKTNGEILDELLTKWEEMGYEFGTLAELCGE